MVKPAGPYLDVIRAVKESTNLPVAAYQVSGEYAQIHAAAKLGWLDYQRRAMKPSSQSNAREQTSFLPTLPKRSREAMPRAVR